MALVQTSVVSGKAYSMETIDELRRFITMISEVDMFVKQMTHKDVALKILMSLCKRFEIILGQVYIMTASWYSIGGLEDLYDTVCDILVETVDDADGQIQRKLSECIEKVSEPTPHTADSVSAMDITSTPGCTKPTQSEHCKIFEENETKVVTMKPEPYCLRSKNPRMQCKEVYELKDFKKQCKEECRVKNPRMQCKEECKLKDHKMQCKEECKLKDHRMQCKEECKLKDHRMQCKEECRLKDPRMQCKDECRLKNPRMQCKEECRLKNPRMQCKEECRLKNPRMQCKEECKLKDHRMQCKEECRLKDPRMQCKDECRLKNPRMQCKEECRLKNPRMQCKDECRLKNPRMQCNEAYCSTNSAPDDVDVKDDSDYKLSVAHEFDDCVMCTASSRGKRNRKQPCPKRNLNLCDVKTDGRIFSSDFNKETKDNNSHIQGKYSDLNMKIAIVKVERERFKTNYGDDEVDENDVYETTVPSDIEHRYSADDIEQISEDADGIVPVPVGKHNTNATSKHSYSFRNKNQWTHVKFLRNKKQSFNKTDSLKMNSLKKRCRASGNFTALKCKKFKKRQSKSSTFVGKKFRAMLGVREPAIGVRRESHQATLSSAGESGADKSAENIDSSNNEQNGNAKSVKLTLQTEEKFNNGTYYERLNNGEQNIRLNKNVSLLKNVSQAFSDNNKIPCKYCSRSFSRQTVLYRHYRTHPEGTFACLRCGVISDTSEELAQHMDDHKLTSKYQCESCGRRFNAVVQYNTHMAGHAKNQCDRCSTSFSTRDKLTRHCWKMHKQYATMIPGTTEGEAMRPGTTEGEATMRPGTTEGEVAMRPGTTEGEATMRPGTTEGDATMRPGTAEGEAFMIPGTPQTGTCDCSGCGKSFNNRTLMLAHKRSHASGELPFQCGPCKLNFVSNKALASHRHTNTHCVKVGETGPGNTFLCQECGKVYSRKFGLQRHMRSHRNNKVYKCRFCDFTSREQNNLQHHMILHFENQRNFVCEICGAAFHTKKTLDGHHTFKHSEERNFSCTQCTLSFKTEAVLKRHCKIHLNQKDHICFCGKGFLRLSNFRRHLKMVHGTEEMLAPANHVATLDCAKKIPVSKTDLSRDLVDKSVIEDMYGKVDDGVEIQTLVDNPVETVRDEAETEQDDDSNHSKDNTAEVSDAAQADHFAAKSDSQMNDRKPVVLINHPYPAGGKWVSFNSDLPEHLRNAEPGVVAEYETDIVPTSSYMSAVSQHETEPTLPRLSQMVFTQRPNETSRIPYEHSDTLPRYTESVNTSLAQQTSVADASQSYTENERLPGHEYPYTARTLHDRQRALQEDLYVRWANEEFAHTLIQSAHGLAHSEAQEEHGQQVYNFTSAAPVQFVSAEGESVSTSIAPQNLSLSHSAGDYSVDMTSANYSQSGQELTGASYSQTRSELAAVDLTDASYSQSGQELANTNYSQSRPELVAVDLTDTNYSQSGQELADASYSQSRQELADASYSQSRQELEAVEITDRTYSQSGQELSAVDMTDANYSQSRRELAAESLAQMSALVTASGYLPSGMLNNNQLL